MKPYFSHYEYNSLKYEEARTCHDWEVINKNGNLECKLNKNRVLPV